MMAIISFEILFVHWLAFLDTLQRLFWNYTPQPLLSTIFPALIEASPVVSQAFHAPRTLNSPDYSGSVDLLTICSVPMIFQGPLVLNFSCRVDHSDYNLYDSTSHRYIVPHSHLPRFTVPDRNELPSSPSQVSGDHAQTNLAPYGARGLSFCPVLVGIMYIHSLLHLYMLLMMLSVFHYWFEDVLFYESLNPAELFYCSRFFHASLWTGTRRLLRYGVCKAILCLCLFRKFTRKPVRPSIPRIVLIQEDGKAIPVNLAEDRLSFIVGITSSFKEESLKMDDDPDAILHGEQMDLTQFDLSAEEGRDASEVEALTERTVAHQEELRDDDNETRGGPEIGSESPATTFVEDCRLQISRVLVEAADELRQPEEEDPLAFPMLEPETPPILNGCDTNEQTGELEQMELLAVAVDDVDQDGANNLGEVENLDLDLLPFSPWDLVTGLDQDETEAISDAASATNPPVELRVTPSPTKSVRFAVGDEARAKDRLQESPNPSQADKFTSVWNLGSELENEIGFVQIPPDQQNTTSPEQLRVPSGEPLDDDSDDMLKESLLPPLTGNPIVKLPSLVVIREAVRFAEMDTMVPVAAIEDAVTRSPPQLLFSNAPVVPVVINMNSLIKVEEQGQESLEIEGLTFESDVAPLEDASCPPIEGWNSAVQITTEFNTSLVTSSNPGVAMTIPKTYERGFEILYETPRHCSFGREFAGPLLSALEGPVALASDATSNSFQSSANLGLLEEPDPENRGDLMIAEKSNDTDVTLVGQAGGSEALAADLSTIDLSASGRVPASPNARKDANRLLVIPASQRICKMDSGESRESDTLPLDYPRSTSDLPLERTLAGSMHAPPMRLPAPRVNSDADGASVLHKAPTLISLARPREQVDVSKTTPKRIQGLSASIHAPHMPPKPEVESSPSQSQDGSGCDHHSSLTSLMETEIKPITRSCPPNWAAMPDVVDGFRMFKQAPSENAIRKTSSISESSKRGPMFKVVDQKGRATKSLNNVSAIADIQNHWMNGNGLLLVRDIVPTDPADFNLRSCTNLRTSRIRVENGTPVQQILYPGMLDIPAYPLAPCPLGVDADTNSMVVGSKVDQSIPVLREADVGTMFGSPRWTTYRG